MLLCTIKQNPRDGTCSVRDMAVDAVTGLPPFAKAAHAFTTAPPRLLELLSSSRTRAHPAALSNPFAVLKRRLERRLRAVGITVTKVHEEEWSYIPVGGPLPLQDQTITAFGAAANLVHPATGFSVTRSLREAPKLAAQIAEALRQELPVGETSSQVWQALWPVEKCRQASFHVFGMELLAVLDLGATNDFFNTFFSLPSFYWRGFLASNLSSAQLVVFAMITFAIAPVGIKAKLVSHLLTDPAGQYLYKHYLGSSSEEGSAQQASAAAALLMFLGSSALQQQQQQ
jgi:lycopene epsilon-cyclase